MLTSLNKFTLCATGFLAAGMLAGCGAANLFPNDAPYTSAIQEAQVGSLQGSVYGGHAPLVGAHIYLVQPGTTGYGSQVTNLLTTNANASSYPLTANGSWPTATSGGYAGDQFVPTGFNGVTTDNNGQFYISNDYTCTVGQPVMLIGYGGSPSYVGQGTGSAASTQTNTFPISSIQVSGLSGQASGAGTATYTFNVGGTTPELFYVGEQVTIAGTSLTANGSGSSTFFNGQTLTVTGTGLSTTSFQTTFTADFGGYPGATTPYFPAQTTTQPAGATVTANPPFNPAVVNVAVLGNCPSNGTFTSGPSALKFVYMNEVSTAAFAYAFNQYANWSANDQTGNDEFHIGSPSTAQALQGMANASLVAGNLYDIQGSNQSTSFAGEGHIARSQTASGAGIVPQATLDTLGNILAACVDSPNTYRAGTGTQSPQCLTLDQYAQDNGVRDTTATTHIAFNIAQAALNIAHYPQGAGTGTTTGQNGSGYGGTQTVTAGTAASAAAFVSGLYNLPTGNVPFMPQLTSAPNDFAVGINWQTSPYAQSGTQTGSTTNQASVGEVAIDSLGNAWIVANGSGVGSPATNANGILKLTPAGYHTFLAGDPFTAVGTTPIAGIAIDTSNNLFISSTAGVQERFASSSYASVNGGATGSNLIGYVNGSVYTQNVTANAGELAVDSSGSPSIYVANLYEANPPLFNFGSVSSQIVKEPAVVGNTAATFTINAAGTGGTANTLNECANADGYLTLDSNNNIWTSNSTYENGGLGANPDQICKLSNTGALLYSYNATSLNGRMIAVDATNNAFWANYVGNSLMGATSTATSASGVNGAASTYTLGNVLTGPIGVAVDGANTLWVISGYNSSTLAHVSDAGVLLSPTVYKGSTGAGGFNTVTGGGTTTPTPAFAVIDQSGNLWTSDTKHGEVLEWIGVAAPTTQPLAQQRYGTANSTGHGIGQLP